MELERRPRLDRAHQREALVLGQILAQQLKVGDEVVEVDARTMMLDDDDETLAPMSDEQRAAVASAISEVRVTATRSCVQKHC